MLEHICIFKTGVRADLTGLCLRELLPASCLTRHRSLSVLALLRAQGAKLAPWTATGEAGVLRRTDQVGPEPRSCRDPHDPRDPHMEDITLATLQPALV